MDPDLMADMCVCPECLDYGCSRCEFTGYLSCDTLGLGEMHLTMLDQRAGVIVCVEE